MALSVVDPIPRAIDRTALVLFRPFDIGKWLRLGFCAFLVSLAQGGGSSPSQTNGGGDGDNGGGGFDMDPMLQWLQDNVSLVVALVFAIALLIFVVQLIFTWLSSRGHFMFLDGIVNNRGAVVQPWEEFREEGNSLFWFRFWLGLFSLAFVGMVLGITAFVAWSDLQEQQFTGNAIGAIIFALVVILPFALLMTIVGVLLTDFVIPIMYLRRASVGEAWGIWYEELLPGNSGTFILYFLFKILIGICVGIVSMMLVVATCCVAAIPFIGTVIMLPILVFVRCYPLYFIEQFGPNWSIFQPSVDPPASETY